MTLLFLKNNLENGEVKKTEAFDQFPSYVKVQYWAFMGHFYLIIFLKETKAEEITRKKTQSWKNAMEGDVRKSQTPRQGDGRSQGVDEDATSEWLERVMAPARPGA